MYKRIRRVTDVQPVCGHDRSREFISTCDVNLVRRYVTGVYKCGVSLGTWRDTNFQKLWSFSVSVEVVNYESLEVWSFSVDTVDYDT